MRILVTRPAEDGAEIARRLEELGHQALLAPLLDVSFFEGPVLDLDGVQALLATSANGVRALAGRTAQRDIPLFAVGPQTAEAARTAGFLRVRSAEGDAVALADAVSHWADPAAGALLHAAGAESGGWLAGALAEKGFTVRREDLYRVDAAMALPDEAVRALRDGSVKAALFFSPRSAQVFAACLERAGLAATGLTAICISANTANALTGLSFAEVRVAAAPNQSALLACL
ncbi:MAG TPA: uroporphyrinogen-III synthase [Rhizomicrobium sp.]